VVLAGEAYRNYPPGHSSRQSTCPSPSAGWLLKGGKLLRSDIPDGVPAFAGRLVYGNTNSPRDPGRLVFLFADRITSRIWVTRRSMFASVKISM
jgi:hypothetical protein